MGWKRDGSNSEGGTFGFFRGIHVDESCVADFPYARDADF
jgi:hypothetical protein